MNYIKIAKHYKSKGLSIIPINATKQPLYSWYLYTTKIASDSEIEEMFKKCFGIGIITGKVSCPKEGFALLVVDIDAKNFDSSINYEQICNSIPKELLDKLFIVRTRSGGYHWYFYTPAEITGNKRYAMRCTSDEEKKVSPDEKVKVLIENRFNGGFVVSPPTENYEVVSTITKIPYLSLEEHSIIIDAMCSFNRVFNDEVALERFQEEKRNKFLINPFEDYDKRCDLLSLLEENGYTQVLTDGDNIRLKRAGATSSHSGYYSISKNRYTNFSTSSLFESGKTYRASEVFTMLMCEGDWKCSYRKLLDMDYGVGLDFSFEVNRVVDMIRKGSVDEVLNYVFDAEKVVDGVYKINGQTVKIK